MLQKGVAAITHGEQYTHVVTRVTYNEVPITEKRGKPHAVFSPLALSYRYLLRWDVVHDQGMGYRL